MIPAWALILLLLPAYPSFDAGWQSAEPMTEDYYVPRPGQKILSDSGLAVYTRNMMILPDPGIRSRMAQEIIYCGNPGVFGSLVKALEKEPCSGVRADMLRALGNVPRVTEKSAQVLTAEAKWNQYHQTVVAGFLNSRNPEERAAAAYALLKNGGSCEADLKKMLKKEKESFVICTVFDNEPDFSCDTLLELLNTAGHVRAGAAFLLARDHFRSSGVQNALLPLVQMNEETVCAAIARGIRDGGVRGKSDLIPLLMNHPSPGVRALIISGSPDPVYLQRAAGMLADERSPAVRAAICNALKNDPSAAVRSLLLGILCDPAETAHVRACALEALASGKLTSIHPVLAEKLEKSDPAALLTLYGASGDRTSGSRICRLIGENRNDPHVAAAGIRALARLGIADEFLDKIAVDAAGEQHPDLLLVMAEILPALESAKAAELLRQFAMHGNERVALKACSGLRANPRAVCWEPAVLRTPSLTVKVEYIRAVSALQTLPPGFVGWCRSVLLAPGGATHEHDFVRAAALKALADHQAEPAVREIVENVKKSIASGMPEKDFAGPLFAEYARQILGGAGTVPALLPQNSDSMVLRSL